jgi:low temperature requirement protein LtrA
VAQQSNEQTEPLAAEGPPEQKEHREYWFEFFYDLVLAAALASMHDAFLKNFSIQTAIVTGSVAAILFTIWLLTTLHLNRFPDPQPLRRLAILVQMAAIVVVVLTVDRPTIIPLNAGLIAYVVALLTVAFLYWQVLPQLAELSSRSQRYIVVFLSVTAATVLLAVFLPRSFALPVVIIALGISLVSVMIGYPPPTDTRHSVDIPHLNERLGSFVVIVIGMVFAQLIIDLDTSVGLPDWRFFVLVFVLMFAIWWMYFGLGVHEKQYATSKYRLLWIVAHYFLLIGIVGMADVLTALAAARDEGIIRIGITYLGVMTGVTLLGFALFVVLIERLGSKAAITLAAIALVTIAYGAMVEVTQLHGLRITATVVVVVVTLSALVLAIVTRADNWKSAIKLR